MIHSTRSDDPADDPTGVHALLRSLPSPGPMPAELVERISDSLRTEGVMRQGTVGDVTPLWAARGRRGLSSRFVLGFAAAAAAAAVVGSFGVNALMNGASNDRAIADSAARLGGVHAAGGTTLRIYHTTSAYTPANVTSQASALVNGSTPATQLPSYAAEAPSLGPIATPVGVGACLASLGVTDPATLVDLGTYDGTPAAIIVTSRAQALQVLVVRRECGGSGAGSSGSTASAGTAGSPGASSVVLAGPLALP